MGKEKKFEIKTVHPAAGIRAPQQERGEPGRILVRLSRRSRPQEGRRRRRGSRIQAEEGEEVLHGQRAAVQAGHCGIEGEIREGGGREIRSSFSDLFMGSLNHNSWMIWLWKNYSIFCMAKLWQIFMVFLIQMQKIVVRLRAERGLLGGPGGGSRRGRGRTRRRGPGGTAAAAAADVLSYVRERNGLWAEQDVNQDGRRKKRGSCDFDGENLPYLDAPEE